MTLALHGKSRKRQGLLGLLAVLAVVLAIAAAGTMRHDASAEPPLNTCDKFEYTDKNTSHSHTAPTGKIISEACIKSGDDAFKTDSGLAQRNGAIPFDSEKGLYNITVDDKYGPHLGTPGSSTYHECFEVTGLGTSSVTISEVSSTGSICKDISHTAVKYEDDPNTFTITAEKVVCDSEEYLPNWAGTSAVTPERVATFVSQNSAHCQYDRTWWFEIAKNSGEVNPLPGDNDLSDARFEPFQGSITLPTDGSYRIREQMPSGYVPFAGINATSADESAEFYCNDDVQYYDNMEWVTPGYNSGQSYCVGFNAPVPQPETGSITVCKVILDPSGNVVTDWSNAPAATFTLPGDSPNPIPTPDKVWDTTSDGPNTDLFADVTGNDANCQTYSGLTVGESTWLNYYYGEESIVSAAGWETPLYREWGPTGKDDLEANASSLTAYTYGDAGAGESGRLADGIIGLRESDQLWRNLLVVNQYQQEPEGTLRIYKLIIGEGGDENDTFTGQYAGVAQGDGFSVSPIGGPAEISVPPGDYTVSENDPTSLGYVLLGYALNFDNQCPTEGLVLTTDPIDVNVPPAGVGIVCIYNTPANEPAMSKAASGFNTTTDRASWVISVFNNVQNAVDQTVQIFDEGVRVDAISGGSCLDVVEGTTVIGAGGISCNVAAGATLQVTVSVDHGQTCEPDTVSNTATVEIDGQQLAGTTTATVDVPGDPDLCSSTVTVQKFYDDDDSNTINAGDSLIDGWGISISCANGFAANGLTGANGTGTIVFTIPEGPYPLNCTITEGTLALVAVIGHSVEGAALEPGASVDVQVTSGDSLSVRFLNDPTDLPPPPPPGPEGPTPPPPPEEPTPEPTEEPVQPTQEPQEPEPTETPAAEATPVAPKAGNGTIEGTRSAGSLWLAAIGLLAISGAAGALALARRTV